MDRHFTDLGELRIYNSKQRGEDARIPWRSDLRIYQRLCENAPPTDQVVHKELRDERFQVLFGRFLNDSVKRV